MHFAANGTSIISHKIVLGTYSFMLTSEELQRRQATKNPATHEWTCLLRGRDPGLDLSTFIRKVVFTLHPSFPHPLRVIESAPFQVEEFGWGEFEIVCKIFFSDPEEKTVELKHYLKLYPENTLDIRTITPPTYPREYCIVAETHDEIIFRSPSERMIQALKESNLKQAAPHPLMPHFGKGFEEDEAEYGAMTELLIHDLREEEKELKSEICRLSAQVQSLMRIFYSLRPDKALALLANYPEALLLARENDELTTQKVVTEIRNAVKNATENVPNTGVLSKEKTQAIVEIFHGLINDGVIAPTGLPLDTASYKFKDYTKRESNPSAGGGNGTGEVLTENGQTTPPPEIEFSE